MGWFAVLIPVVSIIAVFTFVAVASWSENRRKERETYYRHETYRKILEHPGESTRAVVELMREEERRQQQRRVEGLRLGGVITLAAGIGAMVFLYYLVEDEPIYLAGLVAALIGLVLALFGFLSSGRGVGPGPAGKDRSG
jgi:Flp pilus assembly protein TadB